MRFLDYVRQKEAEGEVCVMKKIGISCASVLKQYGIERGLEICKKSGFDAVDMGLERYVLGDEIYGGSEDAFVSHFTKIREKAESLELEISQTHGRCATYFENDEEHNEKIRRVSELDLKASSILGSPACVIHFINSTRWGKQPAEVMREVSAQMFEDLIPYAEQYQVKIALETFGAARVSGARIRDFFADPVEFQMQFDRMKTTYKTMCVDTGHTHEAESFWVPAPEEMIRILGSEISILHLHDNNSHWDDHLLPGMGNIKWPAVFEALEDVGYNGVYNFELAMRFGCMLEEFVGFAGKYLRTFVDNKGDLKRVV